jgi:hypothetical protein
LAPVPASVALPTPFIVIEGEAPSSWSEPLSVSVLATLKASEFMTNGEVTSFVAVLAANVETLNVRPVLAPLGGTEFPCQLVAPLKLPFAVAIHAYCANERSVNIPKEAAVPAARQSARRAFLRGPPNESTALVLWYIFLSS